VIWQFFLIGRPLKEAMKTHKTSISTKTDEPGDVQEGLARVIEKRKPVWKNK